MCANLYFLHSPPLLFHTMSDSMPESMPETEFKENMWWKNEQAHQYMRSKSSSAPYCTFCHHRRCGDPTRVHGSRSLKKSKMCAWRTTKIDRHLWYIPEYLNRRNGEAYNDGRLDVLDEDPLEGLAWTLRLLL